MQKVFPIRVKQIDDFGSFVGFANTYGNEDLVGDVVDRGAFTKTIAERPVVKILFNHNPNCPIGLGTLEDSYAGLVLKGKINLDLQLGREVYSNLKAGILDSLSIGYEVAKKAMEGGVRHLKEVKVFEVSVVTFPANPLAQVTDVKEQSSLVVQLRAQTARMKADVTRIQVAQAQRECAATRAQLRAAIERGRRVTARLAGR